MRPIGHRSFANGTRVAVAESYVGSSRASLRECQDHVRRLASRANGDTVNHALLSGKQVYDRVAGHGRTVNTADRRRILADEEGDGCASRLR